MTDDRRTYGLVWVALAWTAATLRQVDRLEAGFVAYRAASPLDGFRRETPESQRPGSLFWTDVHFLMIAVTHLARTLDMIDSGPKLSKAIRKNAETLRHLLEHWWKAEDEEGAWKGLRERHGSGATPTSLEFTPPNDFKIGPDDLSILELADEVRQIERELADLELRLG